MSKKHELVVKSNRLIEASYRLDLAEQRLVLLAIVRARETGKGLNAVDFVPITAKDYAERFELDEKNAYRQLKEAEDSLFYREFTLYDTDPETGNRRVIKGRWISAASYIDGSGTIQLQFSGVILPYITNLEKKFTGYKLEKIAKMSSPYAIRLYEMLMQWSSRGSRKVELAWLRQTLMVPEDEYPRLFDFKRWVINVAVSQINEFSDLTVRYEQRKTGRNVTHFMFTFEPKEPAESPQAKTWEASADVRESPLFQRLRNLGIGPRLAADWIKQDAGRVATALDYVEGKIEKGEVRGKAAGYFRTVFESGAELGPSAFEADLKAKARQEAEEKKRAEAEQRAKVRAEREALARAQAAVKALTALERLMLAEEYRQGAGADRSASWDAVKGDFRAQMERIQFIAWLQARFKVG